MKSNLEKNQELKALLLEETPWLLMGKNESERKHRVGLLFDHNRLNAEQKNTFRKLKQMQLSNGGWPWFEGGRANASITTHIVTGLGKLMNITKERSSSMQMINNGIGYVDKQMNKRYEWIMAHSRSVHESQLLR